MFPPFSDPSLDISPTEFERLVRNWIVSQGGELTNLEVTHDAKIEAYDSTYQIDVLAKFQAFGGADFTVLIECKKYQGAVEREQVQVLHGKVGSVGAHKGMLFTTSGFQSGAIKYAAAHGIALVSVADGAAAFQTRSAFPVKNQFSGLPNLPRFGLWYVRENERGNISMTAIGRANDEFSAMLDES